MPMMMTMNGADLWAASSVAPADVAAAADWDRALDSLARRAAKLEPREEEDAGNDSKKKKKQKMKEIREPSGTTSGAAASAVDQQRMHVAAVGAKGLGKSTFVRMAATRVLQVAQPGVRVFVLDTDPGQPLFELPGTISLFEAVPAAEGKTDSRKKSDSKQKKKPGKKRPRSNTDVGESRTWQRCSSLFLGDVTSSQHPSSYMDGVMSLFALYELRAGDQPAVLFVNFQGWTLGLGAEMATAIMKMTRIGHLAHLRHSSKADALDYDSSALDRVYRLAPASLSHAAESARLTRFARFANYFAARSLADLEIKRAFVLACPGEVRLATLRADESRDTHLAAAADGALVGLCRLFGSNEDEYGAPDSGGARFELLAMGYVTRSAQDGLVHVVSPASKRDLIARGLSHVVLGTQPAPLVEWEARNADAVAGSTQRPFFVDADLAVDLVPLAGTNRKNLKRRRLASRNRK